MPLRAFGSLAALRCGCSVASLSAGSVTLTDEILNILQGLQQSNVTIFQHRLLRETINPDNPLPNFLGEAKDKKKRS